jgi:hypothetical protein
MVVKRISYFSFLVALTTMATVAPCYVSDGATGPAINTAPRVINKSIATCFDKIAKAFDYSIGVTRAFRETTIKSGKLITRHAELRYSSVRADFHFSGYRIHSQSAALHLTGCRGSVDMAPAYYASAYPQQPGFTLDRRAGIEQKNRVLLE